MKLVNYLSPNQWFQGAGGREEGLTARGIAGSFKEVEMFYILTVMVT